MTRILKAEQISDFRIGTDKMIRKNQRAYVVDTEGIRKAIEVQPDIMTSEFEENIKKLNPEQKMKMISLIETTPYLTDEGRTERLSVLKGG